MALGSVRTSALQVVGDVLARAPWRRPSGRRAARVSSALRWPSRESRTVCARARSAPSPRRSRGSRRCRCRCRRSRRCRSRTRRDRPSAGSPGALVEELVRADVADGGCRHRCRRPAARARAGRPRGRWRRCPRRSPGWRRRSSASATGRRCRRAGRAAGPRPPGRRGRRARRCRRCRCSGCPRSKSLPPQLPPATLAGDDRVGDADGRGVVDRAALVEAALPEKVVLHTLMSLAPKSPPPWSPLAFPEKVQFRISACSPDARSSPPPDAVDAAGHVARERAAMDLEGAVAGQLEPAAVAVVGLVAREGRVGDGRGPRDVHVEAAAGADAGRCRARGRRRSTADAKLYATPPPPPPSAKFPRALTFSRMSAPVPFAAKAPPCPPKAPLPSRVTSRSVKPPVSEK